MPRASAASRRPKLDGNGGGGWRQRHPARKTHRRENAETDRRMHHHQKVALRRVARHSLDCPAEQDHSDGEGGNEPMQCLGDAVVAMLLRQMRRRTSSPHVPSQPRLLFG